MSTSSVQNQLPPILWQGQIQLQVKLGSDGSASRVDLDKSFGRNSGSIQADLELQMSIGSIVTYSLRPINGASAALFDGVLNFDNCLSQKRKLSLGAIPELVEGNQIFVLTNERRIAGTQITQVKIEQSGAAAIDLNVVVWDKVINN